MTVQRNIDFFLSLVVIDDGHLKHNKIVLFLLKIDKPIFLIIERFSVGVYSILYMVGSLLFFFYCSHIVLNPKLKLIVLHVFSTYSAMYIIDDLIHC